MHRIIYEELCLGRVEARSRQIYRDILARLSDSGARGIMEVARWSTSARTPGLVYRPGGVSA